MSAKLITTLCIFDKKLIKKMFSNNQDAMPDVAVVVGASSNLGYQILRKICNSYKGKIYFTTEDERIGYNILKTMRKEGLDIVYHQLDVKDTKSIVDFRHFVQDEEEGIDLIINNTEYVATDKNIPFKEKVRKTLTVNFYGNLNFGNLVYPLLKPNARVVNISGAAGLLATIDNEEFKKKISNPNVTEDELVQLMQEYEEGCLKGNPEFGKWGVKVQAVSKVALNALTFLQHRTWSDKGIVINCVNPGDFNKRSGRNLSKCYEEGAKAVLYVALEAPLSIKGNFVWSNYSVIEWNCDPYVEVTTV